MTPRIFRPSCRSVAALVSATTSLIFLATLDLRNIFEPLPQPHQAGSSLKDLGRDSAFLDVEYNSGLYKREDICNETFPGRYSQTCSPSETLCCIIPGASRPACVTILGYGFCCTEYV
ncbi:hypothetical protein K432DRAFT_55798 [Lepidopterella palustris CBS 459.81]|uniref:Uncharacterized protein n=1 Tax=Lepidopterella palustris CBS 459.81 TaxID=1314670 RepID=A0A8E2JFC5_9PEZI|nr:hypothetical protein K432DRAFT_55798 [Lepidopterella palustris CBS 459.81]